MSQNGNRWSFNSVLAGAGGGFVSSIATCPLDVIKTKLQAQVTAHKDINYLGVWGESSIS
jgi:solute carrier family 25 folate transporter 32